MVVGEKQKNSKTPFVFRNTQTGTNTARMSRNAVTRSILLSLPCLSHYPCTFLLNWVPSSMTSFHKGKLEGSTNNILHKSPLEMIPSNMASMGNSHDENIKSPALLTQLRTASTVLYKTTKDSHKTKGLKY